MSNTENNTEDVKKEDGLIAGLILAYEQYISANVKYKLLVERIREMGCTRKDVLPFMLKQARREGYYSTDDELRKAKNLNLNWYQAIEGLVGHCDRHYHPTKWEYTKKTSKAAMEKAEKDMAEAERVAGLSEDEVEQEKESKKQAKLLEQEIRVAQFIKNNAAAFQRIAEKEGFKTSAETIVTTIKDAIDKGRIGSVK